MDEKDYEANKAKFLDDIEKTRLTLGDILAAAVSLYKADPECLTAKIIFDFDATNGDLNCVVWKSENDVFSLFSNNKDDPRHKDFMVRVRYRLSEAEKKAISNVTKDMKVGDVKRVDLSAMSEEFKKAEEETNNGAQVD